MQKIDRIRQKWLVFFCFVISMFQKKFVGFLLLQTLLFLSGSTYYSYYFSNIKPNSAMFWLVCLLGHSIFLRMVTFCEKGLFFVIWRSLNFWRGCKPSLLYIIAEWICRNSQNKTLLVVVEFCIGPCVQRAYKFHVTYIIVSSLSCMR